jgi:uncharacterized protein GlcG (DUF336 family)
MKISIRAVLAGAALMMPVAVTLAAGVALPGDRGPMGGGARAGGGGGGAGAATDAPRPPAAPRPPDVVAPTPTMAVAMKAAQAIAEACKQYPMALAITDSQGVAKLIYVPDGSAAWHGYSAVRKAYTAVVFKTDSSKILQKAREDAETMEKFKADPNLQAQSGGLVLMVGDKLIGAIGVSGAEPGGHDEECGLVGLEKIKNDLK